MKKLLLASLLVLLFTSKPFAQTKVFREVSNSISTSIRSIVQDGNLVGYLAFTELERANADSFRYRLNIMDENLNDIGVLNFTELKLDLQAVAFEGDVLCLAYMRSNFVGYGDKKRRERKEQLAGAFVSVFTQFVSLDGKIIATNNVKADVKIMDAYNANFWDRNQIGSVLKHRIQLRNMAGKGFVCSFGDNSKSHLILYDAAGKNVWQTDFTVQAEAYAMLLSQHDIYLLCQKTEKLIEGGYWLMGYNVDSKGPFTKKELRDKEGHQLTVKNFENDPVTGRPYLAGYILHPRKGNGVLTAKQLGKGPYLGVYSMQVKGSGTGDIETTYSNWSEGGMADISAKGRYQPTKTFVRFEPVFKDYQGNTFFAGTSYKRKPKWGAIGAAVVTAPTIIVPLWIIGIGGTQKEQSRDAMIFKQDKKGTFSYVTSIPTAHSRWLPGKVSAFSMLSPIDYYAVTNSETKSNYLILSDKKTVNIFDVNQQKIVRKIPRKDGAVTTYIYPAKEGHIMVSEYNSAEKTRTFNIEAL